MRENDSLLPVVLTVAAGFVLLAMVFLSADSVAAENVPGNSGASTNSSTLKCLSSGAQKCETAVKTTIKHRRTIAAQRASLNKGDQMAALRSVQYALSNVGDGGTYLWHRANGRVSSIVRPTESFRDGSGRVCRHIEVRFTSGDYSRATETVACRRESGVWDLSG